MTRAMKRNLAALEADQLASGMLANRYRGPPVTLDNMRENGVRPLAVSCLICHHKAILRVDEWPDHVLRST
jgi:hypothetical protein